MKHLALTNNYADEWEAVEDLTMIQQKVTLESKEGDSHHKSVMGLRTRLPPFLPTGLNFVPTGAQWAHEPYLNYQMPIQCKLWPYLCDAKFLVQSSNIEKNSVNKFDLDVKFKTTRGMHNNSLEI